MICVVQIEEMDADYDPDFLRHIYPRLEWPALREAAQVMGQPPFLMHHYELTKDVTPRSQVQCSIQMPDEQDIACGIA